MSDSVQFIFKTLLKVPVIIFVSFFILNIFTFCYTYFQMLGFSYVVMQTAVENNYLPTTEYNQLNNYLNTIDDSDFIKAGSAKILINDSTEFGYDSTIEPAYGLVTSKRQYGKPVRVGVEYQFRMIWPLMPNDQVADGTNAVTGINNDYADSAYISDAEADQRREDMSPYNAIRFVYTVPGLKYYPDLITY